MNRFFLFLLSLLSLAPLSAQVFSVSHFSIEDGLAQSEVEVVFQDSKGYLWIGTHGGVSRFDGKRFVNYDNRNGLTNVTRVNAIVEDSAQNIWLGTDFGLIGFDGLVFQNYTSANFVSGEVTALFVDAANVVWMGTKENGLFSCTKGEIKKIFPEIQTHIHQIAADKKRNIWIAANAGLFLVKNNKIQKYTLPQNLSATAIWTRDPDEIWVGTNKGLFSFANEKFTEIQTQHLPDNEVHSITQDYAGTVWFGTGKGLAYLENKSTEVQWFQTLNWEQNVLVMATFQDIEGNLWLGTGGKELFKIRKGVFRNYNSQTSNMQSDFPKSFLEDAAQNLWISTYNNGIDKREGAVFSHIDEKQGLASNRICASLADSKKRLWFATYNAGVSCYENGKFSNYSSQNGLSGDAAYCIAEMPDGNIWIGTNNGISVWNGQAFSYLRVNGGLINNTIYAIFPDSKGNIWVGTQAGVSRITNNKVQNFTTANGLSDNFVLAIKEDAWGKIWLATSNGISVYDGKKWQKVNVQGASQANRIVSLLFENDTTLWFGSEYGVFRTHIAENLKLPLAFDHFTRTDGLPSLECNGNALYKDSKGYIWIGTIAGAARYPADSSHIDLHIKPRLHITRVRTSMDTLNLHAYASKFDRITGLPLDLELPYNQSTLVFDYIGIYNWNPSVVSYQVKLDGLESEWQNVNDVNSMRYPQLSPGKYTFLVRASNDKGNTWTEAESFSFTILKPWYATWWFRLLVLAILGIIAALVWAFFRDRRMQEKEKQKIQQKSDMLALEQQALYAMMNPHFTFNALQSIQYYIHIQDKLSATKFLSNFAKLVRMNLDSSKSDFIALSEEIERLKLYLNLEKMRFQDKFEYEIIVDEDIDRSESQVPPMILQPFVENSLKHGIMPLEVMGHILVHISRASEDTLLVKIEDNGIGIEASKQRKQNRPSDHVSKGMQITLDRLNLFSNITKREYKIHIFDRKNEVGEVIGASVEIDLPAKLNELD